MDVYDLVRRSDIISLLDEAKDELDVTKSVILIRVMNDGDLRMRAINLNDYETVGILESAKLEALVDDDDV